MVVSNQERDHLHQFLTSDLHQLWNELAKSARRQQQTQMQQPYIHKDTHTHTHTLTVHAVREWVKPHTYEGTTWTWAYGNIT